MLPRGASRRAACKSQHDRFRWKTKMVDGIDKTLPLVLQWVFGLLGVRTQWVTVPRRSAVDYRSQAAGWKVLSDTGLPNGWNLARGGETSPWFQPASVRGLPPTLGVPPRRAGSVFRLR